MFFALGLWGAAAALFSAGEGCDALQLTVFAAGGLAFGVVGFVALAIMRNKKSAVLLTALGLALGASLGSLGAAQMHQVQEEFQGQTIDCAMELTGDASSGSFGYSAPVKVAAAGETFRARLTGLEEPLFCGQQLKGRFVFAAPSEKSQGFYWQNGFALRATAKEFGQMEGPMPLSLFRGLRQRAIEGIEASGASQSAILAALACGYKGAIVEEGIYDNFKWSGTAHLVAVSGAHLSLVAFAIEFIAKRAGVGRRGRTVLLCLFVAAYVLFSGVPISAIRAAFMVVCALLGAMAKRRSASLNALAICIILFIVLDPACALSVSFALSAGSTLGILLFSQKIASWFSFLPERCQDWLVAPVALTLASQLATLPLSCALFSQLSTVALPCNIIASPLFAPSCIAALVSALAVAVSPAFGAVAQLASLVCSPLRWTVDLAASLPYACISVEAGVVQALAVSLALSTLLYCGWRKASGKVAAVATGMAAVAVVFAVVVVPLFAPPQLVMLDVGQGDALLVTSKGRNVLVDTGEEDEMLLAALARHNVRHLDAVVVTHSDRDHYRSLAALRPYVAVDAVYAHEGVLACGCENCEAFLQCAQESGLAVQGISAGSTLAVGEVTLRVAGPISFSAKGGNDDSLCLLGEVPRENGGAWRFLLTGDAESRMVSQAMAAVEVEDLDIIKVGHHGSKDAVSESLLSHLTPSAALISVGEGNSYGHPHDSTLQLLEAASAKVLRTDSSGDVTAAFLPAAIEITLQKSSEDL